MPSARPQGRLYERARRGNRVLRETRPVPLKTERGDAVGSQRTGVGWRAPLDLQARPVGSNIWVPKHQHKSSGWIFAATGKGPRS